jgi:hypothetical protein
MSRTPVSNGQITRAVVDGDHLVNDGTGGRYENAIMRGAK